CRWDGNGNGSACQGHADQASCSTDTAHHCTWWIDTTSWRAPDGCTGLEAFTEDSTAADYDGAGGGYSGADDLFALRGVGLGTAFKPGNPGGIFCNDPPVGNFCGDNGDVGGLDADLLGGPLTRVIQYLGHGDLNDVPLEGRDLRFFFKQFSMAYAKYVTN